MKVILEELSTKLQQSILTEDAIKGRTKPYKVIAMVLVGSAYATAIGLLLKSLPI